MRKVNRFFRLSFSLAVGGFRLILVAFARLKLKRER
jgi:hypothetical protein